MLIFDKRSQHFTGRRIRSTGSLNTITKIEYQTVEINIVHDYVGFKLDRTHTAAMNGHGIYKDPRLPKPYRVRVPIRVFENGNFRRRIRVIGRGYNHDELPTAHLLYDRARIDYYIRAGGRKPVLNNPHLFNHFVLRTMVNIVREGRPGRGKHLYWFQANEELMLLWEEAVRRCEQVDVRYPTSPDVSGGVIEDSTAVRVSLNDSFIMSAIAFVSFYHRA
jgi:hypothetical protein